MKCAAPVTLARTVVPCGQCLMCRINRRRAWTLRMVLEQYSHDYSSFVTLTYDDEHLTLTEDGLPTLVSADLRNYFKRLRRSGLRFRYFAVGEYGDETQRPHYHIALYGHTLCSNGHTTRHTRAGYCCPSCSALQRHWPFGAIHQGELNDATIQYTAGYTTKKLTGKNDYRLKGRYPEFTRQSKCPGLGHERLLELSKILDTSLLDVPKSLRTAGRIWPLDRFSRNRLRRFLGRVERSAFAPSPSNAWLELQVLLAGEEDTRELKKKEDVKAKLKEQQLLNKQRNFSSRNKL